MRMLLFFLLEVFAVNCGRLGFKIEVGRETDNRPSVQHAYAGFFFGEGGGEGQSPVCAA
jgi:hypothetical protein